MAEEESLIEFPCDFPIKVMGEFDPDFATHVSAVIRELLPEFNPKTIESRLSSGGKYISLTCVVHVHTKPQLDSIYMALSSHPLVKVVL